MLIVARAGLTPTLCRACFSFTTEPRYLSRLRSMLVRCSVEIEWQINQISQSDIRTKNEIFIKRLKSITLLELVFFEIE